MLIEEGRQLVLWHFDATVLDRTGWLLMRVYTDGGLVTRHRMHPASAHELAAFIQARVPRPPEPVGDQDRLHLPTFRTPAGSIPDGFALCLRCEHLIDVSDLARSCSGKAP